MLFNSDLVEDAARQKLVLFLGAGVSASAQPTNGLPLKGWDNFLREITGKVSDSIKIQAQELLDKKDYLLACEILKTSLKDEWDSLVQNEYQRAAPPSELHNSIKNLDQRITITTNFDKLIEMSWGQNETNGKYPILITKIDENSFKLFKDHSSRYLIKIHGTVDDPSTIIFSKSEYIKSAIGSTIYQSFIETLLLNYTFLFIGFSMDDPAICGLMEMYALKYPKARPHYAILPEKIPENIVDISKNLRKLSIIQYNTEDNHANLPKILNELSSEMLGKRRQIYANAFL